MGINGTGGRWDKFWIGMLIAFIVPLITFVFTWEGMSHMEYRDAYYMLFDPVFKNYLIMLMMPDSMVFFVGYKMDIFRFCRGAVIGFLPYMLLLIYLFCV
ncbi:MAG: hypothetical protein J5808_00290 [Paludibacteraceae bacterium]|nr:hypothetical protein [Paludibacteraceae bacterium]